MGLDGVSLGTDLTKASKAAFASGSTDTNTANPIPTQPSP
jgi:hypothetical protein